MEALRQDIRYGIRMLMAKPSFTIIAVLALALGIGVNSAIFSIVNGVLLKPLGYKEPDKLVRIWEKWGGFDQGSVAYPNFKDWRDRNKTFENVVVYRWTEFNLTGVDQPERVLGRQVSADFLPLLGVNPAIGRNFTHEEDRAGANRVAIIADSLWKSRFNGDSAVLGKTISLDGTPYQIVGVLPANFSFFFNAAQLLVPIEAADFRALKERAWHPGIQAMARLKPGVTIDQARADMNSIANALGQEFPDSNKEHGVTLTSLYDDTVGDVRANLWFLFAAVTLVLLIACANVANLMLARASSRQKEIAIRSALGAGRSRIIRLLITESVMLALIGGALGLLAAYWGTSAALKALPNVLPRANEITVDHNVLLFTLAASIITGIVFGLAPALQASNPNLNETLKDGGRSGTAGRQGLRSALVVAEIAISLVLLVGAGLLIRSFVALNQVSSGFDDHNVLTFDVSLSAKEFSDSNNKTDAPKVRRFIKDFVEKVSALPGVQATATTDLLPLSGGDDEEQFYVTDRPRPSLSELPLAMFYTVSPGYQQALRIPLLEGRFFDERDTQSSQLVIVIDENMAKRYFSDRDPIGQHLSLPIPNSADYEFQIIGVVGHVKQQNLDTPDGAIVSPQMYITYNQVPDEFVFAGSSFVVRTFADPASYVSAIRQSLNSIGGTATLAGAKTMMELRADQISNRRLVLILIGVFSGLALLLASIGIYGVISYSVAQRTREIGIRMALGASQMQVFSLIVGGGAKLALIGIALGAVGAYLLARLITFILFGVSPFDPITFTAMSLILGSVAVFASYVPARRAMKIDPNTALRYE